MLWVERLTLTNFRNYEQLSLNAGPEPQVLIGANGAGKTNLLEAVSLLAPGTGPAPRALPGIGAWRRRRQLGVAARVHTQLGPVDIGTGLAAPVGDEERRAAASCASTAPRQSGSGVLADYVEIVWVTPAMDGLFTGPASERRRFLDRLILCFDHGYRTIALGSSSARCRAQPAARRRRARQRAASKASSR